MNTAALSPIFNQRRAGVLLHPSSLPCSESCYGDQVRNAFGTLGKDAYQFVDFMAEAGLTVWQMLPTGPTQDDLSPYQSLSAHAGNPDLISFDWLAERGWIKPHSITATPERTAMAKARQQAAVQFFAYLSSEAGAETAKLYQEFCYNNRYWLDDFSLYIALRNQYQQQTWCNWPTALRQRNPDALKRAGQELNEQVQLVCFEQFAFFQQWHALHKYAQSKGIYLFGDMPIFVGHDSADVWAQQHYFQLDGEGRPTMVSGVPPDYFSETGQHWGHPHYAWDAMAADGFQWWLARFKTQLNLFDVIRIDHFRGFEAYWAIPGDAKDARSGEWVKAPGAALLDACIKAYPQLPLVAENLGIITPEVEALRQQFQLPGMLVLQFAFDGNTGNPHLPHNHLPAEVIYTGTHDNDTSLGWYEQLNEEQRGQLRRYCFESSKKMPWLLIELAMASVGRMAIIPMQDFMELDGRHRMNMPGTMDKNWVWKFYWDQLDPDLAQRIRQPLEAFQRLG